MLAGAAGGGASVEPMTLLLLARCDDDDDDERFYLFVRDEETRFTQDPADLRSDWTRCRNETRKPSMLFPPPPLFAEHIIGLSKSTSFKFDFHSEV